MLGKRNPPYALTPPGRPSDWGSLLLESISQIPIFGIARNLFDALRGISFCSSGRWTIEAVSSTPSGRCTMRNHDFVSDGFLAVTAASLVLLCSGLLAIAFS